MTDLHPDMEILDWNTHAISKLRHTAIGATAKRSKPNANSQRKFLNLKAASAASH
jgi:hypothetical protein